MGVNLKSGVEARSFYHTIATILEGFFPSGMKTTGAL